MGGSVGGGGVMECVVQLGFVVWLELLSLCGVGKAQHACNVRQERKELSASPCGKPSLISNEPMSHPAFCTSKGLPLGIACQKMAIETAWFVPVHVKRIFEMLS
jgi:hypothetical protein